MNQITLLIFILSVVPPASLQGSTFSYVLSVRILSQNRKIVCPDPGSFFLARYGDFLCSHGGLLIIFYRKGMGTGEVRWFGGFQKKGSRLLYFAGISWFFIGWDFINGIGRVGHVVLLGSSHSFHPLSEGALLLKTNFRKGCWRAWLLLCILEEVSLSLLNIHACYLPIWPGGQNPAFCLLTKTNPSCSKRKNNPSSMCYFPVRCVWVCLWWSHYA